MITLLVSESIWKFNSKQELQLEAKSTFVSFLTVLFFRFSFFLNICKQKIDLLEKSRVVIRAQGERAFHIFYQMIAGTDQGENGIGVVDCFSVLCYYVLFLVVVVLGRLVLGRDANKFEYLKKSQCTTVPSINDSADFQQVVQSLDTLGFSVEEKKTMWAILSGILHLGNVNV
jgi:myosin-5